MQYRGLKGRCAPLGNSLPGRLLTILGLAVLATSANAQNLTIQAKLDGSNVLTNIGTLTSAVTAGGSESGSFTLNPALNLGLRQTMMNDAAGMTMCSVQFRFFQVITYDDEPVTWQGNIITPAGTANHTGTVVDVPSGGWDYESTTGNKGGDDTAPWYESDTANNPATGNPYRFPGLSYPALHNAPDATHTGNVNTSDAPGLGAANHQTLFETYIAYFSPNQRFSNTIQILGGYSWGIQTNGAGVQSGIGPTDISFANINAAKLTELQGALNRSGYNNWTVTASQAISTPEPSTMVSLSLLVLSTSVFVRRRLRRKR